MRFYNFTSLEHSVVITYNFMHISKLKLVSFEINNRKFSCNSTEMQCAYCSPNSVEFVLYMKEIVQFTDLFSRISYRSIFILSVINYLTCTG